MTLGSVDYLQDWYTNKNQFVTRHKKGTIGIQAVMGKSLFCVGSEVPGLSERRKALSGAFFKSRLVGMCQVIKQVTLHQIKRI